MSNSQHGMTTIPSKSNASPKVLPHGLSVPIAAKNGSARRHDSYLNPTTPRSSADVVLAKKHSDSDSDTEKNNQSDSNSALGTDEERMTQEDSQSRQVNSKARSICSGWTDRSAGKSVDFHVLL